jgi:hypothetical protein
MHLGHANHLPPPPTHLFPTLIRNDAQKPWPDRAAGPHTAEPSPRTNARLLYCILGEVGILQQSGSKTVGRLNKWRKDRLESGDVATLCVDELLLRDVLHNFILNTGGQAKSVSAR